MYNERKKAIWIEYPRSLGMRVWCVVLPYAPVHKETETVKGFA